MIRTIRERDLYSRQESLPLGIPSEAIVVGAGGTGTWVALFLAMSGVKRLHIMDFDNLELSNLARLPYPESEVGKLKTSALLTLLVDLRPELTVECYDRATDMNLALAQGEFLFDCTDNVGTQTRLFEHSKKNDIRYIRVGYDGLHITVTSMPSGFTTDEDTVGYTTTPSWVVPTVMAAALGVYKAMLAKDTEVSGDIGELVRPRREEAGEPNPLSGNALSLVNVGRAIETLREPSSTYIPIGSPYTGGHGVNVWTDTPIIPEEEEESDEESES